MGFAVLFVRVLFILFAAFQAQDLVRRGVKGIFKKQTKTHWIIGRIKFMNKYPLYPIFPSTAYRKDYEESWKEWPIKGDQAWRSGILYLSLGLLFGMFAVILVMRLPM